MTLLQQIIMVSAGVAATMLTRFIPFVAFRPGKPTPKYILYLGKVLPASLFALLVVYCLRHIHSFSADSVAQVAAVAFTILIHVWKEKEYDVVDSSRHPLLYAAHQNLITHISPSTQR